MNGDSPDTVLVVDDDEACRELHTIWLEDRYEVHSAESGREALELAEHTDVVLLDRQMPGMDGGTVARRLHDEGHDCVIVMLSGVEPGFEIVDLPVDEYLTKPVSRDEVRQVVETMFARGVYQRILQEFFSLSARKKTLERRKRPAELAGSDEYRRLCVDLEAKRVTVEGIIAEFDSEWREALYDAVSREVDVVDDVVRV